MLGRQGILHHLCQSMLGGFCFALISCPSHRPGKHPGVGHPNASFSTSATHSKSSAEHSGHSTQGGRPGHYGLRGTELVMHSRRQVMVWKQVR
jgi:hypothetical protein